MIAKAEFKSILDEHCLVRQTRVLPRGHIRADTHLVYPDGAAISVFVERDNFDNLLGFVISDLGNTFAKLDEYGVNPFQTIRLRAIKETVGDLNVRIIKDRLVLDFMEIKDLKLGVIDLAQACLRASCMIFNKRKSQPRLIQDRVHKIIENTQLPFDKDFEFSGPYDAPVKVDYRVKNPSRPSSLLIMKGTHAQANEVFRRWQDLHKASVSDRFLTVFDDRSELERPEDLRRLNDVSDVVSVSNDDLIGRLLTAA
jgi:Domain of unknown function DUF1828